MAGKRHRSARKQAAMERVVSLKLAGASFREIGKEVGVNHTYAWKLFREAMQERRDQLDADVDRYVAQQYDRLERIILAHWSVRGDAAHAAVIMRAIDAQSKLLGLNAPTRVEHGGQVDVVHEDAEARRRRILEETADAIATMSPEDLAREAAGL